MSARSGNHRDRALLGGVAEPRFVKRKISGIASMLFLLATCPVQAGPSFDCSKAARPVEKAICSDAVAADLDGEIAAAYSAARQRLASDPKALAALTDAQRKFLTARDKAFGQPGANLRALLSQRLKALQESPTSAGYSSQKDILAYFALLPEAVFDETTYGLDAQALKLLLEKGRSEDWIFERVHIGKAIVRAIHPTSIVTMTLMDFGHPVLQVHIQNERNETISYWTYAADGQPLKAHHPRAALQSAAAAHHDLEEAGKVPAAILFNPLVGVPSEIVAHVDALEACKKLVGEARGNAPKESAPGKTGQQTGLRCSERAAIGAELRHKHVTSPIAGKMLDRAEIILKK